MQKSIIGFSLIELLICLSLIAFLLLKTVAPDVSAWRLKKEVDGAMQELITLVAMSRSLAINENIMVTLCRSNDGHQCQGSWRDGAIAFADHNADRVLNGADRLLYRMAPLDVAGELRFNSFQNRQYLQMTSRGFSNYQNGNFTFCPENGDARMARQIIISLSGRTRFAIDRDRDGVVEDSQGRSLECK